MLSRGWSYIVKAATIILLCNTVVQIMQTFDLGLGVASSADESILAVIASPIAYLFIPVVGILSWQLAAAAITGFIAKENVVGTLAVCFSITNFIDVEELALTGGANEVAAIMGLTKAAALAYLMFNLYSPPCFAAIGAMSAEIKSAKWFWGGIGLQLGIGYAVAYLVYTLGTVISGESLKIIPAIMGGAAVVIAGILVAAAIIRTNKKLKVEKN